MRSSLWFALAACALLFGCSRSEAPDGTDVATASPEASAPVSNVPPLDPNNIVSIASASPDHTKLVAALKAANYITPVAASGPLTVFAPTDAAFDALPPGTLEHLLDPANVDELREVLKYHVTTSALAATSFTDGQSLGMSNGKPAKIGRQGDTVTINGAKITASIPASNGIVHVIDAVLLPPAPE